jgi:hypothetical protein
VQADLRGVEGCGDGGGDGVARDLAGRGVDARRHVAGHHRRVLRVDRSDRARRRLARRTGEARSEQGIDDDACVGQPRRIERLGGRARQPLQVAQRVAAQLVERGGGEHLHLATLLA